MSGDVKEVKLDPQEMVPVFLSVQHLSAIHAGLLELQGKIGNPVIEHVNNQVAAYLQDRESPKEKA